jgi:aspartate/methionine/tyrosine aminotransferase
VATALEERGLEVRPPGGGFYLWVRAPDDDGWGLTRQLVERAGILGSPGDFYGPAGSPYVRLAMVQPDDRLELGLDRLRRADGWG